MDHFRITVGLPGAPGRREDRLAARPRRLDTALARGRSISLATRPDELTWVWQARGAGGWHVVETFKSGERRASSQA